MASRKLIDNRQRQEARRLPANATTNAAARSAGASRAEDGAVAPGGASQGQKRPDVAPKRRRARGEGAVFRRASDGFWVGALDLGVVDGHRRRKAVYGESEREVAQKLSTLRTAHDRGIDLLAPALTVGQWLDV